MKKLKLLIIIFSLTLCIPLAYFVFRTYRGLEQEEVATLSYFAETLLDEMEQNLAAQLNIRSIPTLILFKNGAEAARTAGAMDKVNLIAWVRQHL